MTVRTTVDIPAPLHDELEHRAQTSGTSIRSLIVRALEQTDRAGEKDEYVTAPPVRGTGKLGPRFPVDENPHDLVLS